MIEEQKLNNKLQFIKHHKCKYIKTKNNRAVELYRNEKGEHVWFMIHESFTNRYKISRCPYCKKQLDNDMKKNKIKECITGIGTTIVIFTVIIGFMCLMEVTYQQIDTKSTIEYNSSDILEDVYLQGEECKPYFYEYEYGYDNEGKRIVKKTFNNKIVVIEKIDP